MTTINGSPAFTAAFNARGVGGLTGQIFEGYGTGVKNFGKFIQIILSFSVVAVVLTNVYSIGLNVQMISNHLVKVPRLIWSLIGGAAFLVSMLPISPLGHILQYKEPSCVALHSTSFKLPVSFDTDFVPRSTTDCRNRRPQPPATSHGRLPQRHRVLADSLPRHHTAGALVLPPRLRLRHLRLGKPEETAIRLRGVYRLLDWHCAGDPVYVADLVRRADCTGCGESAIWHRYLVGAGAGCHDLALSAAPMVGAPDDGVLIILSRNRDREILVDL